MLARNGRVVRGSKLSIRDPVVIEPLYLHQSITPNIPSLPTKTQLNRNRQMKFRELPPSSS